MAFKIAMRDGSSVNAGFVNAYPSFSSTEMKMGELVNVEDGYINLFNIEKCPNAIFACNPENGTTIESEKYEVMMITPDLYLEVPVTVGTDSQIAANLIEGKTCAVTSVGVDASSSTGASYCTLVSKNGAKTKGDTVIVRFK